MAAEHLPAQSERRFEARESMTPGPRTTIWLNIAEHSIPTLLEGINADRVWLTQEEPGVYGFHATQRLGESREQPGTPARDLLTEIANELADLFDTPGVHQSLRDRRDALVERYLAETAPASGETP